MTPSINRYFELVNTRPQEFVNHGEIDIILDREELLRYSEENNRTLGVIYESRFHIFIVDLVRDKKGNVFCYERLLKTNPGGVVILTLHHGNFVLLKQYRHAMRDFQYAFPRGFGELKIDGLQNAKKEMSEELKSNTDNYALLGTVIADSGVCGNEVQVYKCDITDEVATSDSEGIVGGIEVTAAEIQEMIQNRQITDGFTLAALQLYQNSKSN